MTKVRVKRRDVMRWTLFAVIALFAIIMMYPLLWMTSTSVKNNAHVFNTGLIPIEWHFENYVNIWSEVNVLQGLGNSFIITIPISVVSVVTASMAAFAFAKLRFPFRDATFFLMLAASIIPFAAIMLPQYVLFNEMNLLQGPVGYYLPRLAGGAFTIFFLRQYMYGIPDSIIESAKLDGCSFTRCFFSIALPLVMPAVIAQLILGFIGTWNDYLGPLMFIRDRDWQTIPLIISTFNSGASGADNNTPMLMAGSLISMVPIFILFAFFQRRIVDSMMTSGIKL